ncbi:MAG: tetratricopeptide repeat protein, partial [Gemmataceae bacterium]
MSLPRFRPRLESLEDRLTPASHALDLAGHRHQGWVAHTAGLSGVAHGSAAQCLAERGQYLISQGHYHAAVRVFTRLIEAEPTGIEGYRGRIEAQLLLGRFSDAVGDYARVRAFVEPVHPDAQATILDGYAARLKRSPHNVVALTGASFANWWYFEYDRAAHQCNRLLGVRPHDVYANLLRGSSRLLGGTHQKAGVADLDRAIALAPKSADVRFIVADAYTYGLPDPERAFKEASLALKRGLDTPRVHAILATSYHAFGDEAQAAAEIQKHIELVTTDLKTAGPLDAGGSLSLGLVPGRTYDIPLQLAAGEVLSVRTDSPDFYDTLLVLIGPDGSPAVGSDDFTEYFAGLDWAAPQAGTYRLLVTSFEAVNTG